jgi:probable phosphoglycerate mutase
MTQLLLIRHAHNDWVNHRLAGWTDGVHLSEQGRAEAGALAERLHDYRLDAVYASPLERAQETAAYLATPRQLSIVVLPGVGEVRYGEWTGRELKELRQEPLWTVVQQQPSRARFPGGECLAEVQSRAVAAVEGVAENHPEGVVAVVSHGDVIKALLAFYSGLHLDHFQRFAVGTASVSVVRITAGGPRVLLVNDTGSVPPPPEPAAVEAEPAAVTGAA